MPVLQPADACLKLVVFEVVVCNGQLVIAEQHAFRRHFGIPPRGRVPDRIYVLMQIDVFRTIGNVFKERKEPSRTVRTPENVERVRGSIQTDGNRFNSCQVIYSQFGLAIHQNDHQARRRFVEWAQNDIAVVPDFHKQILFSDEAHFWLNGYVNKQNCRIWSEANPQVYVETPLHPEKLTVWCALWAGGILLQKR
ncbi:DUF4817 domain-containing protein [Trichonephila clavipes]|nr:DUF4817 domain-containing protein [Trichonephila clavipes]